MFHRYHVKAYNHPTFRTPKSISQNKNPQKGMP